jgi:hypothetical protein
MSGAFAKRLAVSVGTAAMTATLVSVGLATMGAADNATPPVANGLVSHLVGTYDHLYVGNNAVGSLTLSSDHTLSSSVAGAGHWTLAGKSVALQFDIGGVFVGEVTPKGLNSANQPGAGYEWTLGPTNVTWYATRG